MKNNKQVMTLCKRMLAAIIMISAFFTTLPVSYAAENETTNSTITTAPAITTNIVDADAVTSTDAEDITDTEEPDEFNAVWISYLEFNSRLIDPDTGESGFTEERFIALIDEMFDNVVSLNMNAVVVQVRPFGDAMYPSDYFPWSKYISGTQGVDPGFDPLEYMVEAAHSRGLKFHAWINPYRVTNDTTKVSTLSTSNIAREWRTNTSTLDNRNILTFDGKLYFNPSVVTVRTLIRNGIKEIVENYDVDGIHFDDYFYPTLGANYKKSFDYKEYKVYYYDCKENDETPDSIVVWRRNNVNSLLQNVYSDIKEIDQTVEFGISPGGNISNLLMNDRYYCDVVTWLSEPGYIDYICPQIYWSFSHYSVPFDKTLDRWLALRTNENVKMYVGIATYRAGSSLEEEWKKDSNILKKQVEYSRETGLVDGYIYFRYDFFFMKTTQKAVKNLLSILA
ncbi:MAG: family 10 glycosylhydrolase [Mobilitalea sp.]